MRYEIRPNMIIKNWDNKPCSSTGCTLTVAMGSVSSDGSLITASRVRPRFVDDDLDKLRRKPR